VVAAFALQPAAASRIEPAVRLTSPRVQAYQVLAPVRGGPELADLPPQVKDPPDLVEEAQVAPRAAFRGSEYCEQLSAESFPH
jgi:hypothetical protein